MWPPRFAVARRRSLSPECYRDECGPSIRVTQNCIDTHFASHVRVQFQNATEKFHVEKSVKTLPPVSMARCLVNQKT